MEDALSAISKIKKYIFTMKILLDIATHGNEKLGTDVVKKIEKLHIGNDKLIEKIVYSFFSKIKI